MSYILGFSPTLNNLEESGKVDTWYSVISNVVIDDEKISFRFICAGNCYFVSLVRHQNLVRGIAIVDNEECVECFFTEYKNEKGILLIGEWNEDKKYSCIVELNQMLSVELEGL